VLLHYLAKSKLLILLLCKHNKCKRGKFLDTKTRLFYPPRISGPWHQNKWSVLSGHAAKTGDAARYLCNFWRLLHFSAAQCTHWSIGPVRRSRYSQREVLSCIAANLQSPNSPDPNPVVYKVWSTMQDYVYWGRCKTLTIWSSVWLTCETVWSKASSTTRSTSSVHDFMPVSMQKRDFFNSLCNLQLNFVIK